MLRPFLCTAALLVFFCVSAAKAEETPARLSVADLIKQLDAESFGARQAASEDLTKRGAEVIPALTEAAKSESPETVTRALDILRKQFESSDAGIKAAAKAALQKLATGEGAVARRVAAILATPPANQPAATPNVFPAPAPGGIRVVGGAVGAIRIAVAAAGGDGKRVTVKETDGVKEIEVVEGDRTVKIIEDPAKGIQVKVTTKKEGKEETKEYAAKDAAELKEKEPEAHKLYEQYKAGGGLRVEAVALPALLPAGFAPIAPPGVPAPAAIRRLPGKELAEQLDKVQKQLSEIAAKLKGIPENDAAAAEIKRALEALEQTKKDLDAARATLPAP